MMVTPLVTYFLYRYKMGKQIRDAASAPIMAKLHAGKAGTPTMGGVIVWGTVLIVMLVVHYGAALTSTPVRNRVPSITAHEAGSARG